MSTVKNIRRWSKWEIRVTNKVVIIQVLHEERGRGAYRCRNLETGRILKGVLPHRFRKDVTVREQERPYCDTPNCMGKQHAGGRLCLKCLRKVWRDRG